MAVVRRRRQEETVLEAAADVADGVRELALDAVATAAGRGRVVRFIEDQEAAWEHGPEPLPHRIRVGRLDQEVVGNEKPAVRAPGVHAEASLAAHPRQVGAVKNLEYEAEPFLELSLPLFDDRGRRGHDDGLRLFAKEEFPGDQARFDRLAKPRVVGDEQVDAGEAERFTQGLHLIGIDLNACSERCLEQIRVRGRDAVPAEGVQERCKAAGWVEALGREILPALFLQNPAVDFVVPEHVEGLALGVVVRTGQSDQR